MNRKPAVITLIPRALLLLCALIAAGVAVAQPAAQSVVPVTQPHQVAFGAPDDVIALRAALTPYHAPGGAEKDGSLWYMLALTNDQIRPISRVLLAGQPPSMALAVLPHSTRPAILAVASSDSGVVVEPAPAYGHKAWRVIIPPVTQVGLALQVINAQTPPALYAWTEPALAGHNRALAIFITAVGALIAAAAMHYESPGDPGAVRVRELCRSGGIEAVLKEISQIDAGSPIVAWVADGEEQLRREGWIN